MVPKFKTTEFIEHEKNINLILFSLLCSAIIPFIIAIYFIFTVARDEGQSILDKIYWVGVPGGSNNWLTIAGVMSTICVALYLILAEAGKSQVQGTKEIVALRDNIALQKNKKNIRKYKQNRLYAPISSKESMEYLMDLHSKNTINFTVILFISIMVTTNLYLFTFSIFKNGDLLPGVCFTLLSMLGIYSTYVSLVHFLSGIIFKSAKVHPSTLIFDPPYKEVSQALMYRSINFITIFLSVLILGIYTLNSFGSILVVFIFGQLLFKLFSFAATFMFNSPYGGLKVFSIIFTFLLDLVATLFIFIMLDEFSEGAPLVSKYYEDIPSLSYVDSMITGLFLMTVIFISGFFYIYSSTNPGSKIFLRYNSVLRYNISFLKCLENLEYTVWLSVSFILLGLISGVGKNYGGSFLLLLILVMIPNRYVKFHSFKHLVVYSVNCLVWSSLYALLILRLFLRDDLGYFELIFLILIYVTAIYVSLSIDISRPADFPKFRRFIDKFVLRLENK